MRHVSDPCASSPQPLDQTIIGWMVEMEWSCAFLHAFLPWENCHPPHHFFRETHATDVWRGGKKQPTKFGLDRVRKGDGRPLGATAPLLGPNLPILVSELLWASIVGLCSAFVEKWFDLGLSLFSYFLGPDSTGKWAFSPWALLLCIVRYYALVSFNILNVFSIYSMNALLQIAKHQNLWKLLVLKPYV
jgi:hypothetical protein